MNLRYLAFLSVMSVILSHVTASQGKRMSHVSAELNSYVPYQMGDVSNGCSTGVCPSVI